MRYVLPFALFALGLASAEGEDASLRENAALGYWSASVEVQELDSYGEEWNQAYQAALADGPWDEAVLAPYMDANAEAIREAQRASRMSACTFGLRLDDGFRMRIPHLAKMRLLGKLNLLHGRRLDAQGKTSEAIESWLCGIRMGAHLGQDGTFMGALVAKALISMHIAPLLRIVGQGKVEEADLARIEAAARALGPYGLDWAHAFEVEEAILPFSYRLLLSDPDPLRILDGFWHDDGKPSLRDLARGEATGEEMDAFHQKYHMDPRELLDAEKFRTRLESARETSQRMAGDIVAAFRLSYLEARPRLMKVQDELDRADFLVQSLMTGYAAAPNLSRASLEARRAGLLALVSLLRYRRTNGKDATSLGEDVPLSPFTGKALELVDMPEAIEVRAGYDRAEEAEFVVRLQK